MPHHLARRLPEERNTIVLLGFQAMGTRGRALQDGTQRLRMFGREILVHARLTRRLGWEVHLARHGQKVEIA